MGYHALRHLTAREMINKGAGLNEVQAVLGHENATTTNNYLASLGFNFIRGALALLEDDESHTAKSTATNPQQS